MLEAVVETNPTHQMLHGQHCIECEAWIPPTGGFYIPNVSGQTGPLCESCSHSFRCVSCESLDESVARNQAHLCTSCQLDEDRQSSRDWL